MNSAITDGDRHHPLTFMPTICKVYLNETAVIMDLFKSDLYSNRYMTFVCINMSLYVAVAVIYSFMVF